MITVGDALTVICEEIECDKTNCTGCPLNDLEKLKELIKEIK